MYQLLVAVLLITVAQAVDLNENRQLIGPKFTGTLVKQGEFPGQVALRKDRKSICAASIVNEEWALTVATCVVGTQVNTISVLSGTLDLLSGKGLEHNATKIVIHPLFATNDLKVNNIALIKVKPSFKLDGFIRKAITLPKKNYVPKNGATVNIIGWGINELLLARQGQKAPSQPLYKGELKVDTACSSSIVPTDPLLSATICTKDTDCANFRDVGGAIHITGVAVGLISYAIPDCDLKPDYSQFAPLSDFSDFISETII